MTLSLLIFATNCAGSGIRRFHLRPHAGRALYDVCYIKGKAMKSLNTSITVLAKQTCLTCSALFVVAMIASPVMAKSPMVPSVPELDPTSLASAVALLTGGYFVLKARFRR
jgi:hypothetical protein